MTVREAASALECSASTVYDLCARGLLGHWRIGRAVRIEQTDIDEFKRNARQDARPVMQAGLKHIRPAKRA